jgi:hypothetical protein
VAFWLLNGVNAIDYVIPDVAAPGADWVIVGTGYSNRDGERDLFWQRRSTGTLAVWRMRGTTVEAGLLLSASPDPRWQVVSVGDLDGDAFSDLVFPHGYGPTGRVVSPRRGRPLRGQPQSGIGRRSHVENRRAAVIPRPFWRNRRMTAILNLIAPL